MAMSSAPIMGMGAILMVILLLSGYTSVELANADGSGDSITSFVILEPSPISSEPPPFTSSIALMASSNSAMAFSSSLLKNLAPSTASNTLHWTPVLTPTTTREYDGDDSEGLPFWTYVAIAVAAGAVCGVVLLILCFMCICKKNKKKIQSREDTDHIVQSEQRRKESLKSNLENKVQDMPPAVTTDTFGITSPIVFDDAADVLDVNAFGNKDPVWASTPPSIQELMILRGGLEHETGMKSAQSLNTLLPPEPATSKRRLLSPQPQRKVYGSDGIPRKAMSSQELYQPRANIGKHYALQTSNGDSTYDVPRENLYKSPKPQETTESHYDVPKSALQAHQQTVKAAQPKSTPHPKSLTLPAHKKRESYYDVPKKALAALKESSGDVVVDESLYDVPRSAMTLPHPETTSTKHCGFPKTDRGKHKRSKAQPAAMTRSKPKLSPVTSQGHHYQSSSLYDIPTDCLEMTDHVYDEPPAELIQQITSTARGSGQSMQHLLPDNGLSYSRRSSSQQDLPRARPNNNQPNDRKALLNGGKKNRGHSSHKFFHV